MSPEKAEINVSFQDILEGRAYLRIPFVGKLLLYHWAGAPWADRKPEAYLHPLQVECIAHEEREKIIHGASRLGKSVLGGCDLVHFGMLFNWKFACGAGRYDHVSHEWQYLDRGMKELFAGRRQAFVRLTYRHSPNYHAYEIETIWKARGIGLSTEADDGAAFLGNEFAGVVLGEGSHVSFDILQKKIMRAIDGARMNLAEGSDRQMGVLSIYTTPKGYEGCAAAEWERVMKQTRKQPETLNCGRAPWPETVWLREANILENPAYDKRVYVAREKSLSKAAFAEQYKGQMTFATGRVYPEYNEDSHHRPMPDHSALRSMRFSVGIDTGAYFGAVLLGLAQDDKMWALGEVYTQQETIDVSAVEVQEMVTSILGPVYETEEWEDLCNRIDLWAVDPASQHKLELNAKLDPATMTHPMSQEGGKWELMPTIDTVRELFKQDQLFIVDELIWLPDQLKKYIWKTMKSIGVKNAATVKEPRKEFDHVCDALRIGIVPLNIMGPLEELPPPVTQAEAWERARKEQIFGPLRDAMAHAERVNRSKMI